MGKKEIEDRDPLAIVDGQMINVATLADLAGSIIARARRRRGFTVFTLNLDHLVKRRVDPVFRAIYSRATFVSADGAPVAALARRACKRMERTTGADLVLPVCEAAAREGIALHFFGSTQDSLDKAAQELRRMFPDIDIRATESPPRNFDPMSAEAADAGARIAASGAAICFVALGAPKQELFSDRMAALYPDVGFLCIGAALDFVSGEQKRAPGFLQKIGLEWGWRLATNPRRMALRYARCFALLADIALIEPLQRKFAPAIPARGGAMQ